MKRVIYLAPARKALLKHTAEAKRIVDKVDAYANDPSRFPKVKALKGNVGKRLRVGAFRVIFEETSNDVIVIDIGPRGSIYD